MRKEIENKLAKWREERGLSVEEQRKNFNVNFTEELAEFFKAQRDGNEYEMIDALCDMIVVAINAGHTFGYQDDEFYNDESTEFRLTSPFIYEDSLHLIALEIRQMGYDPYKCLLETIKELNSRQGEWNEKEGKWKKDVGCYSVEDGIKRLSKFKNVRIDTEVYPETEDTYTFVYWDYEYDESVYVTMKKWYKADYSKCKNV